MLVIRPDVAILPDNATSIADDKADWELVSFL